MAVDDAGNIHPTDPVTGASTFADPSKAPLTGKYHSLAEGTQLPRGVGVKADGVDVGGVHPETHHTIFPVVTMPFSEFEEMFKNLPWQYAGKK